MDSTVVADHKTMYGWAEIEPAGRITAGSTTSFTLTYHVGRYGIDDGGRRFACALPRIGATLNLRIPRG